MLAAGRLRVFAGPPKSRAAEGVLSLSKCPLLYILPRRRRTVVAHYPLLTLNRSPPS